MSAAFIYTQQDLKPTSPDNGTTEISPNTTPRRNKPIQLSPTLRTNCNSIIEKLLRTKIIGRLDSPWCASICGTQVQ